MFLSEEIISTPLVDQVELNGNMGLKVKTLKDKDMYALSENSLLNSKTCQMNLAKNFLKYLGISFDTS